MKSLFDLILGNKDEIESERYFLITTCITASVLLLTLCIVHIIESLSLGPVFLAASASVTFFLLYYFIRFRSCLIIPKLIMTIGGLIMLDITWYAKFLSTGPVLMFILVFGALIIWVYHGRSLIYMLSFYFLNIIVLFIIEYLSPEAISSYPDSGTRTIDIYLSFFFYSFLLIFLLSRVKKEYIHQKNKAVKSDQLKSAFLANMSHEIRTPLNSIVGFSELLREEEDEEKKAQYHDIINNSSGTLLNLITDIIDLSKIEIGDTVLDYSSFSIEELFQLMKDIYTNELLNRKKDQVKIDYQLPEGDLIIYSDSGRLKQILTNLLSNAVKFTSSGHISFNCRNEGKELLFSVSDTGIGIKDTDQKKIFHRFTKFDHNGINSEGTGIGLSIVERIISLLNGKIWFESKFGEGSSFYFSIPYVKGTLDPKSSTGSLQNRAIEKNGRKKKILLVEDDEMNTLLLKEILKPLSHDVIHFEDGKEAISYVKSNPDVAVCLMDISLPTISGYAASGQIKEINPNVTIIAQTANALEGDKDKALKSGCDHYISKPINPDELLSLLKFLN